MGGGTGTGGDSPRDLAVQHAIAVRAIELEVAAGKARLKYHSVALMARSFGLREALAILRGEDPDKVIEP